MDVYGDNSEVVTETMHHILQELRCDVGYKFRLRLPYQTHAHCPTRDINVGVLQREGVRTVSLGDDTTLEFVPPPHLAPYLDSD